MLKINLLPPYIYEKRKVRQAALSFGLLFCALIFVMLGWWFKLSNNERELTAQGAIMKQKAEQVTQLSALVAAEEAKIPPIQQKVSFIEGIMAYNLKWPPILEELAKYTYSRIMYKSVTPSGENQLAISAHARSVGDCGRYLLNMYRAQHLFTSVTISGVPGWSSQGAANIGMPGMGMPGGFATSGESLAGFDFTVTCVLAADKAAIVAPVPPGSAAGAAAPGASPGGRASPGGPVGSVPMEIGPNM